MSTIKIKGESEFEASLADEIPCGKRCCDSSLSSNSTQVSQAPKEISIIVESIEALDYCKIKEVIIKMEFNDAVLAESDPIPIERNYNEMNLTGIIKAGEVTPQFMDDVLSNPVIITVYNCTSTPGHVKEERERKKRNSMSSASSKTLANHLQQSLQKIGLCNLDIGELVLGKKRIKDTLIVEPEITVSISEKKSWMKLPKIGVDACVSCDFVPDVLLKTTNAIGITVECVYNPPLYFKEGSSFKARIPLPQLGDIQNYLVFPNGKITVRDSDCRRKWLNLLYIEGSGGRSHHLISSDVSDVINTLPKKTCLEKVMLTLKDVIEWNTWKNNILLKGDTSFIYSKIMKYRLWPIEVQLVHKPLPVKISKPEKKGKSSTAQHQLPPPIAPTESRFIAYLNLSALLYPGVTKTRVAAQLYTFSPYDLRTKCGIDLETVQSRISFGRSKPQTVMSKISTKEVEEKPSEARDLKETPGEPVYNEDGLPTFIVVDLELFRPFVPKKEPEFLQEQLNKYLCPKEKRPKKDVNLVQAKKKFGNTILTMTALLIQEYQKFCKSCKLNINEVEDVEKEFVDYISSLDKIQKVKASLEEDMFQLINERFGPKNYTEKLPEIYISLVEEMYKITNTAITTSNTSTPSINLKNLQLFAEEAYEENRFDLAKEYLLLELNNEPNNPHSWVEYAIYLIKREEHEAAVEAIREALSLDSCHPIGLLLYGLLMSRSQSLRIAELAFQVLLSKFPDFIEGWISLRMLYQALYNTEGEVVANQTAKKLEYQQKGLLLEYKKSKENNLASSAVESKTADLTDEETGPLNAIEQSVAEPLSWTSSLAPPDDGYLKTAVLLLKLGIHEYAALALSLAQTNQECRHSPYEAYYNGVCLYTQQKYVEAICVLDNFAKHYGKDCHVWALMGHCYYKLGRDEKAIPCYEYVMECYNRPDDIHLIYLRMGYYFLKVKKYTCAKQIFLTACKYSPTPNLWKGIGIACLGLCELEDAETAFSEANYLDNSDAEIWAYLAETNAKLNRHVIFQHCYAEAKKRNLSNMEIDQEIESAVHFNLVNLDY